MALLLAAIAIGSIAALVSGGDFLDAPLPGGLPAGNFLAAVALCALAGAAIAISRVRTMTRYLAIASLVAACAWLPLSIGLAGNLALNFGGDRGETWLWLTLATTGVVLLALATATIDRLFRRRRAPDAADRGR